MKHKMFVFGVILAVILISANATAAILKGPYVQAVTSNSAVIMWETERPSIDKLCYGQDTLDTCITDDEETAVHAIKLEGLAPETRYLYRVESYGLDISAVLAFKTAPEPGSKPCRFVVFGDTRSGHIIHTQVIGLVAELKPELVVHTGDFVDDGDSPEDWQKFFDIEAAILGTTPLFPVLGNHDERGNTLYDTYLTYPNRTEGKRYYRFDWGVCRFIVLDTEEDLSEGSDQFHWLEAELTEANQDDGVKRLFVFFHRPCYSSGWHADEGTKFCESLHPLFAQYGVDAVFNGHDHDYERSERDGVLYIVTGGGGAPYLAADNDENFIPNADRNPYRQKFLGTFHAVLVEAGTDGFRLQMYDLTRRMRDEVVIGSPPQKAEEQANECEPHTGTGGGSGGCDATSAVWAAIVLAGGLVWRSIRTRSSKK